MIACILAIGAIVIWVTLQAFPPVRAVRLRNAWLMRPSNAQDFAWTPADIPSGFQVEQRSPTRSFIDVVRNLSIDSSNDDWVRSQRLAGHLTEAARDLGAIQADLGTTYEQVRAGYGYCADFVKVFLALAHTAGVFARQWAFSFDGYGGHGHVLVEIYDRRRNKWLLLDVYNNFYAADATTLEPLSVMEFRSALLAERGPARLLVSGPGRPGYVHEESALDYYRRGLDQWYLTWGNAVFSYDAQPFVRLASRVKGGFGQLVAAVLGVHPEVRMLETQHNAVQIAELLVLRRKLRWAFGCLVLLLVLLVLQLGYEHMALRGVVTP